jgi:hypothetical protein
MDTPNSEPTAVVQTTNRCSEGKWPHVIRRLIALVSLKYSVTLCIKQTPSDILKI